MWHKSFTILTKEVNANQVWTVITDINRWNEWDDEIEFTKLVGEPKFGASFELKPKEGPITQLNISQFDKPSIFADIAHLPLAKMETIHTMSQTLEGLVIRVDIKIKGFLSLLWIRVIGNKQIESGPDQTKKLIERAKLISNQLNE